MAFAFFDLGKMKAKGYRSLFNCCLSGRIMFHRPGTHLCRLNYGEEVGEREWNWVNFEEWKNIVNFIKQASAGGPELLIWNSSKQQKKGIFLPYIEKYLHAGFETLITFGYYSKAKFYISSNAFSLKSNILRILNKSGKYRQLKQKHSIFKLL